MNPEKPSRDEIEAKLTALLLGELPAEEAQLLQWAVSQDAALAQMHDRLKATIGFVSEVVTHPAETIPAQTAPLKLSGEKREKLLAHFKTVQPIVFLPPLPKRREISPLLMMAAAVAIIAMLAAMLLPALSKAKSKAQSRGQYSMAMEREKTRSLDIQPAVTQSDIDQNSPATTAPKANEFTLTPHALPDGNRAEIAGVVNNAPSQPQVAVGQRVSALEAYVANTDPTAGSGDAWKKQTTIVLPASGAIGGDLAVASPALSGGNANTLGYGLAGVNSLRDSGDGKLQNAGPQPNLDDYKLVPQTPHSLDPPPMWVRKSDGMRAPADTAKILEKEMNEKSYSKIDVAGQAVAPTSPVTAPQFAGALPSANDSGGGGVGGGSQQWIGAETSDRQTQMRATDIKTVVPEFAFNLGDKEGAVNLNGNALPASAAENKDAFFASGLTRDDVSGLRYLYATSNVQKEPADQSGFDGNTDAKAAADKLPMLGDLPAMGRMFQSKPVNQNGGIAAAAAPVNDNLGVAKDENGNLAFSDGNVQQGSVEQYRGAIRQANGSITPLSGRPVFTETLPAPSTSMPTPSAIQPSSPAPVLTMSLPPVVVAQNTSSTSELRPMRERPSQLQPQSTPVEDHPIQKTPSPAPIPTPEILTRENAFSTFSLNVSDVSFKLAAASLEHGQLPDAASIRSEEFINAFNYHDPEPAAGVPVAFVAERARDPFAHNRDLLRFSIKTAAAGREAGRPLNIVLLLDNSGSMERADRVAIIHEALKVLASQLQPQDMLSIVTFARTPRLWVDGARGDQAGTVVNQVSDLTPEGGTNLEEAMNLAYATARRHYLANGVNRVVLLTDGAANLGNVDPEALKQKVETQRKQGIALDCFGIGWEGYNDDLLEQLSSNGDGRYGFINTPEAATTEFAAQLAGALHVAAQDVKVQVEFNPARVTSYRQIGYAKHQLTQQQFRDNTVDAAEIAAQEAGNALYTVEVNPQGVGPVATVRVRYKVPGTGEYREQAWEVPFDGNAPALEQSSPAMRLAATASAFSEWLASSPFAHEVTTDRLLNYLNGVPAIYGADARPKQLETMIREAKSLSGK